MSEVLMNDELDVLACGEDKVNVLTCARRSL